MEAKEVAFMHVCTTATFHEGLGGDKVAGFWTLFGKILHF